MVHLGPLSYLEINGQDVTDLVQCEGDPVPVLVETPFGPRETVADWLRANDIDPDDVPIDGPITIERDSTGGPWSIRYAALLRKDGRRYRDEATGDPAQELRAAPLKVDTTENMQVRKI